MKSVAQNKRYLQHEVTTKLYAVKLYPQFILSQLLAGDTYNVDMSKSSIIQVKNKYGIDKLERLTKRVENRTLQSEKEKLVFETFKHFEIISV